METEYRQVGRHVQRLADAVCIGNLPGYACADHAGCRKDIQTVNGNMQKPECRSAFRQEVPDMPGEGRGGIFRLKGRAGLPHGN
ncbi:MAG: hypothetical protein OXF20_15865 [Gammaproteobacteria bacterium]|nr:hypothetical protein [Gammaproteobacteria bacterium]